MTQLVSYDNLTPAGKTVANGYDPAFHKVPNVSNTQCHAFMYGLDDRGQVWFKRDNDEDWAKEPMGWRGSEQ